MLIRKLVAVVTFAVLRFESSSLHFVVRYGFTHRKKVYDPGGQFCHGILACRVFPPRKEGGFLVGLESNPLDGCEEEDFSVK